ncbi:MAG: glycine cleavage system protein GcvH [Candidatus Ratteibacteria bacterium]|nr:glycine cleavage system protein GcvH [Candidatus Ratteibacteria bacterium]
MLVPKDLKYTTSHEWVKLEGDVVRVGITDYAQQELGEVVFVELPDLETYLEQSSGLGIVESVKSVSEIYAPLSGQIIEVNNELANNPQLVNQDPYGQGWLVALKVDLKGDRHELDSLIDSEEYQSRSDGATA